MRRLLRLVPVAVLLTACGGSSNKADQGGAVLQTIRISEQEYSLTPSTATVSKSGTYEFEVTNNGQVAHALEVEGNGVEEKTADIQPGSSATLSVSLSKPGSYEMYCPVDGHRGQGMDGTLEVGAGGAAGGMTTDENEGTTTKPGY
jgi:uncharacterized cupredoxin-like copper-binding protein